MINEVVEVRKLVLKSEERRLLYAEVYTPLIVDVDNETMDPASVEQMAHDFIASGKYTRVDTVHDKEENGSRIVESFIVRHKEDPDGFLRGSWVVGIVVPPDIWIKVKKGDLNAISFSGKSNSVRTKAKVLQVRKLDGYTEKSTYGLVPTHKHDMSISFNKDGIVIPGRTGESMGHTHLIVKTCATHKFLDHAHRVIIAGGSGDTHG